MTGGPLAPTVIRTERLLLRPWRADDAAQLAPVLEANVAHLADWIPRHVSAPAPVDALAERLAGYAADLAAGRTWRYGIFPLDGLGVYGEASLFCRSEAGRVRFGEGNRAEIGYWLRHDVTGRGYATEASRAMVALADTLPGIDRIEIRCDVRNAASAAVPGRLGFQLENPAVDGGRPEGMVWVRATTRRPEVVEPRAPRRSNGSGGRLLP